MVSLRRQKKGTENDNNDLDHGHIETYAYHWSSRDVRVSIGAYEAA